VLEVGSSSRNGTTKKASQDGARRVLLRVRLPDTPGFLSELGLAGARCSGQHSWRFSSCIVSVIAKPSFNCLSCSRVTGTPNITGRNNGRTVERSEMKRAILAMDPNNPTLRVESKESLRVLGSLGSECCQTHAAKVRDECSSLADERGFAAFGAV